MTLKEAFTKVNDSEESRLELIKFIFHNKNLKDTIKINLQNRGGQLDVINSVYNDMIVQFVKTAFGYKNIDEVYGKLEPYLVGIAKHLWSAELNKNKLTIVSIEYEHKEFSLQPSPEQLFLTSERKEILATLLENLRSNCKAVLMHWANGFSMQEIAEKLNYQSEGMARKKKSQCMSELNDYLMSNPHIKNTLLS